MLPPGAEACCAPVLLAVPLTWPPAAGACSTLTLPPPDIICAFAAAGTGSRCVALTLPPTAGACAAGGGALAAFALAWLFAKALDDEAGGGRPCEEDVEAVLVSSSNSDSLSDTQMMPPAAGGGGMARDVRAPRPKLLEPRRLPLPAANKPVRLGMRTPTPQPIQALLHLPVAKTLVSLLPEANTSLPRAAAHEDIALEGGGDKPTTHCRL